MRIADISPSYTVRKIDAADIDDVYALACKNELFYRYCPPFVSKDSILSDMEALPPNNTHDDKYYIGFWTNNHLVAVMDLIMNYPNPASILIGFFMVDQAFQGKGIGSNIIRDLLTYAKNLGYVFARLGYVKGNPQSKAFWHKNGFCKTGEAYQAQGYTVVVMEKRLAEGN